jgi:F0F1-type ATP synthase membrane subunit c/vacuolar-type H+-ATPase subunit K
MRLLARSLGAAVLIAGCCLSIPAGNVLANSLAASSSAPDLSDQTQQKKSWTPR